MIYFLLIVLALIIACPIYLVWANKRIAANLRKLEWLNSQEYTVLRIDVPRNNDKSPLAAEQMFASIHGIFADNAEFQNHLSFEIISRDKYIQFYIYLPTHLRDFVEGQIYAQYPTVEVNEVADYTAATDFKSKSVAICDLGLTKPDVYPIKQFTDFEVDPISGITSVMSKLNDGEEAWFQMIIRPIGEKWQEKGHSMVEMVRAGKKSGKKKIAKQIFGALISGIKLVILHIVSPGAEIPEVAAKEVKLPSSVEEALKSIETKITKLGYETRVKIIALAGDPVSARIKCQSVAASFKQFNTNNLNGFKPSVIAINDAALLADVIGRSFEGEGNILNISELASLYHFPHASVATPNIVWAGSKKGEPPANLPLRENVPAEDFTVLGLSNFRNQFREFGIKKDDRRRHIYIIGKSGTGKSTLIENMCVNDIIAGRGTIIVDPHGETAERALKCVPSERIKDVIVFDPADREFPIAFNLLEHVEDDFKGLVASGFVGIFKKIFGESWGPRLEHILRNTILALLDYPDSTMLDIPRMLTNNRFRDKVVEKVKDMVIKDFWVNEFAQYDAKFRTEAVAPILNKVGQFLSSATIRNIVGQAHSSFDVREIMDSQKIMIVNLSRGKIGEDNSALLGAMMITKIQLAAMSRADVDVSKRPDCYLYVDEFQNFATDSFATILSEARKYNLCLTMAHQYIAQMQETVRDAVFGNAGTLISFRVGATDATELVKEYEPVFEANDMVNLDKYHTYVKLLIDGISSPAFSARMLPPVVGETENYQKAMEWSRGHYSQAKTAVEAEIEDKKKREDEEMKKEAEMYKTGGLEALLLKRSSDSSASNTVVAPKPTATVFTTSAVGESEPISLEPKNNENISPSTVSEIETEVEHHPRDLKPIKTDHILDGKLYKEKTARGGIKWYVGEEIDEEKLLKSGVVIDEDGRKMIELSEKVSTHSKDKKTEPKDPDDKNIPKSGGNIEPPKPTEQGNTQKTPTTLQTPIVGNSASATTAYKLEEGQAVQIAE